MLKKLPLGAVAACGLFAMEAYADEAVLEEVTVTARKQAETLQSVPLSVTALRGEDLEEQGIRVASDLQRAVPSLSIVPGDTAFPSGVMFNLRGVAGQVNLLTFSQPVGLSSLSIDIPHTPGNNSAFFDIERVEVVAGPQGTLYGRNTTGGAISVITRGPDYGNAHGFAYAEGGNFRDYKLAGAVSLTLVPDLLAVRLAYQHWGREGFGESIMTHQRLGANHDDDIARLSVRFDPGSQFSAQFKLEYSRFHHTDTLATLPQFANPGLAGLADAEYAAEGMPFGPRLPSQLVNGNIFENAQGSRAFDRLTAWHSALTLRWSLSDAISLTSITGYHEFTQYRAFDFSALPIQDIVGGIGVGGLQPYSPTDYGTYAVPLRPDQRDRFRSEEVDLAGTFFEGRVKSQLGAYGSWDSGDESQTLVNLPALSAAQVGSQFGVPFLPFVLSTVTPSTTTNTWAVFSQSDVSLVKTLSVTLGGRYTKETVGDHTTQFAYPLVPGMGFYVCYPSFTGPFPTSDGCAARQAESAHGVSYLASLNWQVTPDDLLYLKTSRGFRGGAVNPRVPFSPPIEPEKVTDYELGLKSDFGHRLRVNAAIYDTEYHNKQELSAQGTVVNIANAAQARIRGFEMQFMAVATQNLELYGSSSYTDGKYLKYLNASTDFGVVPDASGQPFAISKWKFDVGTRYRRHLGAYRGEIGADYSWKSAIPTTALNDAVAAGLASPSQQSSWRRSRGLVNAQAQLTLPDSGWTSGITLGLSATNLLNEHYQLEGQSIDVGVTSVTQEPRMWWLSIRKSFGGEE